MNDESIEKNLYWHLLRVAISSKHVLVEIAEKHDLTVTQLYALCILGESQAIPMNSLSTLLFCDASNVTGIVDRLLTHDLIKREENPKDRRVKIITVTEKGEKLRNDIFDELPKLARTGVSKLSDEKKRQLSDLLEEVLEN